MHSMSSEKSDKISRVVSSLIPYNPEKIILFGSVARGDADQYSDIDLIIIKKTNIRFIQRLVDVTAFLPKDVAIDVLVYTPDEIKTMIEAGNSFIKKALAEGKVLYENTPGNC